MIKQIKPNWFVASKEDVCEPDILFIRVTDNELWHICWRKPGPHDSEYYLCGHVRWDIILKTYHCSRFNCYTKFDLVDVWSDPQLTGYEGKA